MLGVLLSPSTRVYYIRLVRFSRSNDPITVPIYFFVPLSETQAYFIAFISLFNICFYFIQGPFCYMLFQTCLSFIEYGLV